MTAMEKQVHPEPPREPEPKLPPEQQPQQGGGTGAESALRQLKLWEQRRAAGKASDPSERPS
jgi:hypothetical protein